jgi:hypothetical protein
MAVPTNPDHSSTTGDPYQSFSRRQRGSDSEGRTWGEMPLDEFLFEAELPVATTQITGSLAGRNNQKLLNSAPSDSAVYEPAKTLNQLVLSRFLICKPEDTRQTVSSDVGRELVMPEDLTQIHVAIEASVEPFERSDMPVEVESLGNVSLSARSVEDRNEQVLEALSKNSAPSLVENQELLLLFFKKHKFSPEVIEPALIELAKLTPDSLKALLNELARPRSALWGFVNFSIKSLQQGTEAEIQTKIQEFFGSSITNCDFSEICRVARAVYEIESSIPKERSSASKPALELVHASQGLLAVRGDQARYQKQFMETVQEACKKIDKEPFDEVLKYIANRRREMAKPSCEEAEERNWFGVRRRNPNDHFHTKMVGPYEKYRDLFLKSDKQGWKFDPESLLYQLEFVPEGKETPIRLTSIEMDVDRSSRYETRPVTVWYHTPQENIADVLKEAERIFNKLPDPKTVAHTNAGLEVVMEAVGELHWWLAQACPYERGSAAIAKMMACAVLRHYGIEAGGFGSTEPDCMALIQFPDEFIENYSKLMVFPPPKWI